MFYLIPTKNGIGVEVWGTYDDIRSLHYFIQSFWGDEVNPSLPNSENRDNTISGFSRELRKTYEGSRLKRSSSHFSLEEIEHYGCKISWVHIILALSALRFNMKCSETNKLEVSMLMQLEYWLERSAISYDEKGGLKLKPYIHGAIDGGVKHIYQLLISINIEFLRFNGGKRAFRRLPNLLNKGVELTTEFENYYRFINLEAQRLKCEIDELDISDSDIDYEKLKW